MRGLIIALLVSVGLADTIQWRVDSTNPARAIESSREQYDVRISHTGSGDSLITIKTRYCKGTQTKCGTQTKTNAQGVEIFNAFYHNGAYEGVVKEYYDKGAIKSETPFKAGKREGEFRSYYENGALKMSQLYANHKREGEGKKYYPNGVLQESYTYANDKREGVRREFDKQGKLAYETMYKADKKQWMKHYDSSGKLLAEKNCQWQSCY